MLAEQTHGLTEESVTEGTCPSLGGFLSYLLGQELLSLPMPPENDHLPVSTSLTCHFPDLRTAAPGSSSLLYLDGDPTFLPSLCRSIWVVS